MRYDTLSRIILETLAVSSEIMIGSFLVPHPKTRMARLLLGLDPFSRRPRYSSPEAAKHSLSSMLYHLKKDGLVVMHGPKKKALWSITQKGRRVLRKSPPPQHHTAVDELPPEDGISRLVAFDVPEKQRAKRQWLRVALMSCGFQPIQRSVFLGHRPLSEDIVKEISDMDMDRYIHIVSIQKHGTLRAQRKNPL